MNRNKDLGLHIGGDMGFFGFMWSLEQVGNCMILLGFLGLGEDVEGPGTPYLWGLFQD